MFILKGTITSFTLLPSVVISKCNVRQFYFNYSVNKVLESDFHAGPFALLLNTDFSCVN